MIVAVYVRITAVTPSDFEAFYESYKSLIEDNLSTEHPGESLALKIMNFKHPEVFIF